MTKYQTTRLLALTLVAVTAISCDPTLPDLQPFAKATEEMSEAIARGYQETQSQYTEALDNIKSDKGDVSFGDVSVGGVTKDCNKSENHFVTECINAREQLCRSQGNQSKASCLRWKREIAKYYSKALKATLNGMTDYSNSLAAVAEAGNKGKASVEAVANSLTGLISAASPLITPLAALDVAANPVISGVIQAAKAINGYVAKVRARKKLQEAVNDSAEAVAKLEIVLNYTIGYLQEINRAAAVKLADDFRDANQPFVDYHESKLRMISILYQTIPLIDRYFQIPDGDGGEATRLEVYKQVRDLNNSLPDCPAAACPDHTMRADKLKGLRKEAQDQLKPLRDEIDFTKTQYAAFAKKYQEIKDRGERNSRLLDVAGEAVTAWSNGHKDLQSLLNKNSRRATFLALISLGKELVVIYEDSKKEGE